MSRTGYRKPIMKRLMDLSIERANGCVEWIGQLNDRGYGVIKIDGIRKGAHVISWVAAGGDIPEEYCVLHICDNRKCINPAHLFLGTKGDNNRDRHAKGRSRNQHTKIVFERLV